MNDILKFMQMAVQDQITTAGETVTITRPTNRDFNITVSAVITSRDGSYSAAVGGSEYSVTGHALIRKSDVKSDVESDVNVEIKSGDNLQQSTGEKWMIVNAISSSNDAGISCDLVRKQ